MDAEGDNFSDEHPLSDLFESCYNTTAIDEYSAIVIELLKEWSTTSCIYLWVRLREAVETIPSLSAALIGGIFDACKDSYYFHGT